MPIDKPYAYHRPSESGLARITKLREHFSEGERLMRELCVDHEGKPTRQQAIALTNNEQTAMWAIKAVVFNDPASVVEDQAPPPADEGDDSLRMHAPEFGQGATSPAPDEPFTGPVEVCGAVHSVTGASCHLPPGHTQNHLGVFGGGTAQWPK